jgi:hypothetical protein
MSWVEKIFFKRSVKKEDLMSMASVEWAWQRTHKITSLIDGMLETIGRAVISGGVEVDFPDRWEIYPPQMIKMIVKALYVYGKAFLETDGLFLYWIPPMIIEKDPNNSEYFMLSNGRRISKSRVIQFTLPDLDYKPKSVLEVLDTELQLDDIVIDALKMYYTNSMMPSVILNAPNLKPHQEEELRKAFLERFKAKPNAIHILGGAEVKLLEVPHKLDTQTTNDIEQLLMKRLAIALGIPLYKIGLMQYSANEERRFYAEVIRPLQEYLSYVFLQWDWQVNFLPNIRSMENLPQLVDAVASGIITINEARKVLGLPPIEGGDDAYIMSPEGKTDVGGEDA